MEKQLKGYKRTRAEDELMDAEVQIVRFCQKIMFSDEMVAQEERLNGKKGKAIFTNCHQCSKMF